MKIIYLLRFFAERAVYAAKEPALLSSINMLQQFQRKTRLFYILYSISAFYVQPHVFLVNYKIVSRRHFERNFWKSRLVLRTLKDTAKAQMF